MDDYMRWLVVREPEKAPHIIFWMGEVTHVSMMKAKGFHHSDVSSAGCVTYRRDKADFFITDYYQFADISDPKIEEEDREKILHGVRSIYGHDDAVKNQLADLFEAKQKNNARIMEKFFTGRQ